MNRQMTCGTSSISFQNPVFIQSCASVVSRKEGEGPLGAYFDTICEDPMFGTDTWEAAESTLQKQAALLAIKKNGLTCSDIQLLFAGDLLAQTSASSFGTADLKIPFYGLFGACSTMGESLSLGSMCIDGGYGKYILCATSSHFASAEKEFRFPLAYGNQRPLSATWTVTGRRCLCLSGTLPVPEIPEKTDPLISAEGCAKLKDGRLAFGTNHGLIILNTKQIKNKEKILSVTFTDLKLNGISVRPADMDSPLTAALAYTDAISLKYYQSSFVIDFSTFDYPISTNTRFSYNLKDMTMTGVFLLH